LYVYDVFDPPANITRHIMLRLRKFRFLCVETIFPGQCAIPEALDLVVFFF